MGRRRLEVTWDGDEICVQSMALADEYLAAPKKKAAKKTPAKKA